MTESDGSTPVTSKNARIGAVGLLACVTALVALLVLTFTGRVEGPLALLFAVPLILLAKLAWKFRRG